MSNLVGLIPAAGKATRWGGMYKELLPVGNDRAVMDITFDAMKMAGVKDFVVVTTPEKIHTHAEFLAKERFKDFNIMLVFQKYDKDLLGAVKSALPFCIDKQVYFAMPDTIYPIDSFPVEANSLRIGLFVSDTPERFGAIIDNTVRDKDLSLKGLNNIPCWGTLSWTPEVTRMILSSTHSTFANVLDSVLGRFTGRHYRLKYYYDIASWNQYKEWINGQDSNTN